MKTAQAVIGWFRKRAHKCDLRYFEHHAFHKGSLFMLRWWRCDDCGDVWGRELLLVVRKEQFDEATRNRVTFNPDGSATMEIGVVKP